MSNRCGELSVSGRYRVSGIEKFRKMASATMHARRATRGSVSVRSTDGSTERRL
jgi:hypothetical protein